VIVTGDQWGTPRPLIHLATAARHHPAFESLIGRFAQARPFAGDLRDEPPVGEVIDRSARDLLTLLDLDRAPLHQALASLPSPADRQLPLSLLLQLKSFPMSVLPEGAPWVAASGREPDGDTPLIISAEPCADGSMRIVCRLTPSPGCDRDLTSLSNRIIAALRRLTHFIDCPASEMIEALACLDSPARPDPEAPLTRQWNATIIDRILARVRLDPDAIAVESATGPLTYQELFSLACSVTADLRQAGMQQGDPVIITGPASAGTAVAMLAVMLGRGVMVPLPDSLPQAAFAERVSAVGASLYVAVAEPRPWFEPTVRLGADGRSLGVRHPVPVSDQPRDLPTPDDQAYVFFTSGSAGCVRSVVGLHGSLSQFLDWQSHQFRIERHDRVAMLTSIGFDPVLRNVFLPWVVGGCLVIPPPDLGHDGVIEWIAASAITVVHLTPALGDLWLSETAGQTSEGALRWAFFSGEPLTGATIRRWRGTLLHPGTIVNLYGPTETCMVRSAYCPPSMVDDTIQPVGWAIPGSQLLVMRDDGDLCVPGEAGEIVIRTVHGTAGYGNDPDMWAERVTHGPAPGEIRYRTADRGWYRSDGAVVVDGRLDDEVKIHGVRVDPADVAARLRRMPAVKTAVVIPSRRADGTIGLLGAVVAASSGLTATDLRSTLAEQLPSAAIPRQFIVIDKLPLTANGKLDRAALLNHATAFATAVEPATGHIGEVEAKVIRIWQAVFPEHAVGGDTNFFDIGGHSLMALRLIHQIKTEFAVALPLRTVFSSDTPAAMARVVSESIAGRTQPPPPLHEIRPPETSACFVSGAEQRVPASRAQLPFLELHDINPLLASLVIGPMRVLLGPLDLEVLQSALDLMVRRHPVFRAWFDAETREQVIAAQAHLPIHVVHRDDHALDMTELHQFVIDTAARTIEDWPLIRPVLVRLAPEQHLLAIVAQHAVIDGRSNDILIDELRTAYEALIAGQAPALAPIRSGAQEVVDHEQQLLAAGVLRTDLAYWREVLVPPIQVLDLPTDRPRRAAADTAGQHVRLRIRPTTRACIEAAAAEHGASTFRVITALWAAYLAGLVPDVTEVPLTTPSTVREVPDAASMTG
ncbi:MAG: AMP-binding protein, partial [Actinobacteria bacterium]|nr:AMP-binding protein [Actinomycetota bacterium]